MVFTRQFGFTVIKVVVFNIVGHRIAGNHKDIGECGLCLAMWQISSLYEYRQIQLDLFSTSSSDFTKGKK